MSDTTENSLESNIAEAKIYVSFQKYDLAENIIDGVLRSYPYHAKALEIKKRIDSERSDPPTNYHVGFLIGVVGLVILIAILLSTYEGIALYGMSGCLILFGVIMIPDFIKFRWKPYKEGKIKYLFKHIKQNKD